MLNDEIVIYQPWGGLGDNMAHTVLPELCHELGIKCYLSEQNNYRNNDIYNFVWKKNPFITGIKNNTDLTWVQKLPHVEKIGMNLIEAVQKVHNLPVKYHYPKIYYSPKKIENLAGKTIIDLSAYSIGKEYDANLLKRIVDNYKLEKENTYNIETPKVTYGTKYDTGFNSYTINSLEHYSDVIFSCSRFIALYSGQACLASTIKHQTNCDVEINVITLDRYLPSNNVGYTFKNSNYISQHQI
jgi:hypothetical protein